MAPAERVLWDAVRDRRAFGVRFRRSHVIAGYLADFYAPSFRLVVEVDGAVHDAQREDDARRSEHLEALGLVVLRIANSEVLEDLPAVLERIALACRLTKPRS